MVDLQQQIYCVYNVQCFILNAFKVNNQVNVRVVYTDFPKAFDKIDHSSLANKLSIKCTRVRDPFISWQILFLTDQKQYVKFKNYSSYVYKVTSEVPQVSHRPSDSYSF